MYRRNVKLPKIFFIFSFGCVVLLELVDGCMTAVGEKLFELNGLATFDIRGVFFLKKFLKKLPQNVYQMV